MGKIVVIATLLFSVLLAYWLEPGGDRWFAVGVWLVLTVIVGTIVLLMPVLHCPDCDRATPYMNNYRAWTARLTGNARQNVKCRHCGCIFDRLTSRVIGRMPLGESRVIDRMVFLFR